MKILRFVQPFLAEHKARICLYISISTLLWSLSLLSPYSVGDFIDKLVETQNVDAIWNTVSILSIIWILQIVLSYIKNLVMTYLHSKVCFCISQDILKYVSKLPFSFLSETDHASLNQRISFDARVITGYVFGDIEGVVSSVLTIGIAGYLVAILNSGVITMLALLMPIYVLVFLVFKTPLYKLKLMVSEEYSRYYACSDKYLANLKSIKLHEWQIRFLNRISETYEAVHDITMKNAKVGFALANIDMVIRCLANISIFVHCGYQIIHQNMSVGEFTMINTYSTMIISCVGSILNFGKRYQQNAVSYDRLKSLYNQKPEKNGIIQSRETSEIVVNKLSFSYGHKPILVDFSCRFEKGKIYAIVGENGAGKSTLLNILSGIEQNYSGLVTFNGIDLRLLDHHFLRARILSIVEQEPDLVFPTLEENIAESIDEGRDIIEEIVALNLLDFFNSIGKKLDFIVADRSLNLSGGEKQKIATIRCLLKEAEVLILDEPNSAFDEESTAMLCSILKNAKKDRIIIIITHRPELQTISDMIVSLDANESVNQ